jgi:membrane protease YdiL (CAAX protease family)
MDSLETWLRRVFINRERELRSGWRIAAFIICLYVLSLLMGGMVYLARVFLPSVRNIIQPPAPGEQPDRALLRFGLESAASLCSVIIATYLCATMLEHRTFRSVGFKLHGGWRRLLVIGSLLGCGTLGLTIAAETALGSAAFTSQHHPATQLLSSFFGMLVVFVMAAAFEELVFRGFAFQALVHNTGPAVAIVITSVFFGLAHLGNPNPTIISTVNTIVAGIWLSAAYLVTRSLWLSTSLHYSWNLAMVFVFGLPVSGISTFDTLGLLAGQDKPPVMVSGGDYGPEGGIAATVVLLLSTLLIWRSGWFTVPREMAEAIKHGSPEPRYISIAPGAHDRDDGPSPQP